MGKIVVTEFISLDGVVEAPGGGDFVYKGWTFAFDRGADGERFKVDEALGAEALLIGRHTYESFAAAWPSVDDELGAKYNGMPKYVVSSTLTDPSWNNTAVLSGDVIAEVTALKERVDGEIQVPGSIQLVQDLVEHDLVDELHLMTFPVVLGTGRRLIDRTSDMSRWRLIEALTVGEGITITTFARSTVPAE
jgi:dihydrofolate reductase